MTISLDDAKAVAYLYEASLNRQADLGGLNFWIDVVDNNGYSLQQLATAFLESNEYAQNFGDPDQQSNEDFVEVLYNNILGRVSDPAGFDFWTGVLENGTPKNEVLLLFAIATENKAASPYIDTLAEGLGGNYYFASDGKDVPDIIFDDNDGKVGIGTVAVNTETSSRPRKVTARRLNGCSQEPWKRRRLRRSLLRLPMTSPNLVSPSSKALPSQAPSFRLWMSSPSTMICGAPSRKRQLNTSPKSPPVSPFSNRTKTRRLSRPSAAASISSRALRA